MKLASSSALLTTLKRLLPILSLLLLALPLAAAQGDAEDPVVLRMGTTTMTLSELDLRFEVALRSVALNQGLEITDELRLQLLNFRPQFLEQRVSEVVLLGEAERRGLAPSEESIDTILDNIRSNLLEGQTFEELLAETGFGEEAFLRLMVTEAETIDLLMTSMRDEMIVSDDQLTIAYQLNKDRFSVAEQVCARHILIDTEADAQAVLTDLADGADFAQLAAERSTGPSGPNGGDLGCFTRGRMVAPFEEASFGAALGQPTDTIETQFGFHVILVYDRQEASFTPREQVAGQLEQGIREERLNEIIAILTRIAGVQTFPEVLVVEQVPGEEGSE